MGKKIIGIILSSKCVDNVMTQVFGCVNTGLVPIKGKPAITYIIDKYIQLGIKDIYVTIDFEKNKLMKLLNTIYNNKVNIYFRETKDVNGKKISGLEQIIREVDFDKVIFNIADHVMFYNNEILEYNEPVILIADSNENIKNFINVETDENNYVKNFVLNVPNNKRSIALGLVYINDSKILKEFNGNFSLFSLANHIFSLQKVKAVKVEKWFCTNCIFKYYEAKKELLVSRFFNSFEYNDLKSTITKRSTNVKKLKKEILWFLNLPKELQAFVPKILNYSIDDMPFMEMEYYGYPSLSEMFVYGDFSEQIWETILKRLISVLDEFHKIKSNISEESFREIYYNKSINRAQTLIETNPFFAKMLANEKIKVNGVEYFNLNHFKDMLLDMTAKLYNKDDCSVIHGDYFFANILYDVNNGIVRVLDPRGEWGDSIIYGDSKYDIAKLSHSIHGKYDFIVNGMFELDYDENYINFKILNLREMNDSLTKSFDKFISERYDIKQIRLIESLLFLSMIPLHADHFKRQIVQYATGIKMLNEVVYGTK